MDNATIKTSRHTEERKLEFFHAFSREAPYIRDSIARDLPAYNMLLSIHSESFEENILRQLAHERNIAYNKEDPPLPECPYCKTEANVRKKEECTYLCRTCKHTFTANHNSISSGTKVSPLVWMKVLYCLINHVGITKTCEYCDIAENTYYKIRNRLFYAMQLMMDEVKLYGKIEVDNTFVKSSYKGVDLNPGMEFPEESIFFDTRFKPRMPRARGGSYRNGERNPNNICIFTAIDDRGHVLARFCGVGVTCFSSLKEYVPKEKFVLNVPENDPFGEFMKVQSSEPKTQPGDASLMIADKEGAIKKFATNHIEIDFESHVYRRKGVQMKLAAGANNIQRVNALHRRLKDHLRDSGYVSSKYLPGYLVLFEFIQNTGASKEAIAELFKILAKPNIGKPAQFYQDLFSVPNYLEEWLNSDDPISKLPYNKVLAFYLYDKIRNKSGVLEGITMERIEEETGYTAPTIRKIYRELNDAGYRDLILAYFAKKESKKPREIDGAKIEKLDKKIYSPKTFNPIVLAMYDEYFKIRQLPRAQQTLFEDFLAKKNAQYGTNFKRTTLIGKFKAIGESGLREPLPKPKKLHDDSDPYRLPHDKAAAILEDYEKLKLSYREKGEKVPTNQVLYEKMQEKWKYSYSTIQNYLMSGRRIRREKRKKEENTEEPV